MADKKIKEKKKGGRAKFLPFGKYFLILLILVAQAVLAFQIVDNNYGKFFQFIDNLIQPEPGVYQLSELIVNPAGSNGQRFLVVEISLDIRDEKHIELIDKNNQKIRHNMIEVLSSRTVSQLNMYNEREKLRNELAEVINDAIGVPSVRNLYYTRYVMQ